MIENMEHLHYVALAYLAAAGVIVFLVLQSLLAAIVTQRAWDAAAQKPSPDDDNGDAA